VRTQVSDLYECAREKYNLTLQGGQAGLNNSSSWVYLAEDIQNMSFLKGGELVITTGLFTQSGVRLYDFIYALVMRNCSGILINTGKYLHPDDITPEIVEFCNGNNFPIFTMPWEVHLVDIMQDYCSLLLHSSQREEQLDASFQNALYQTPVQENILRTLNQFGFASVSDYRVMTIQNLPDATRITSSLNGYGLRYHLFEHDNLHILIYNSSRNKLLMNEIIDMICFCDSIKLGVSDIIHSLTEIGMCYKRARFSLAAAVFWKRQFVNFDDLGLFQVLFCTSDPGLLQTIYKRQLGLLEQHDVSHDSDYLNTLRIFLLSDCNILETAFRMHTHRNTIVYRIRKIKELLNTELNDSAVKFDFLMAFYIKEYFSI
jgi:hypothetical protein